MRAAKGTCKINGPYCVGLNSILDAQSARGVAVNQSMNFKTGALRPVVTHPAKWQGKKYVMIFSYCPCCGKRVNSKAAKKGDAVGERK